MKKIVWIELLSGNNQKSRIQNLKWAVFLTILVLLVGCVETAEAQQPAKEFRIGVLGAPEEPRFSEVVAGLKKGLAALGYAPKALQIFEVKIARTDEDNTKSTVVGLLQKRVQVLFLIGSRLVKPAREASVDVPIVFITPGDPVSAGLVSSLARPGGNTTAMTFEYPELSGKRLELLKEIAPRVRRVLALYDPRDPSPRQGVAVARQVTPKLGLALVEREARNHEQMLQGLEVLEDVDAYLSIPGGFPTGYYDEITHRANTSGVSTIFHARTGDTSDALASYGASDVQIAGEAARLVDKILRGTKAGDLPVERPTKLELILNLKTAKQIGLTIPPNMLARADRVIK